MGYSLPRFNLFNYEFSNFLTLVLATNVVLALIVDMCCAGVGDKLSEIHTDNIGVDNKGRVITNRIQNEQLLSHNHTFEDILDLNNTSLNQNNMTNDSGTICRGNFSIKNSSENLSLIANCTRIEGYLHIISFISESQEILDNIRLPLLVEITDYLFIFNIKFVTTLEWFPNLQYIRGRVLFSGNSLVIHTLESLRHLGFHKLKHIKGGVRIEEVNNLCLAHTFDYSILAEAIKSNSVKSGESQQLLPGFKFWSRNQTQVNVKWNYTPKIRNKSIDYFIIDLIEFEDLAVKLQSDKCEVNDTTSPFVHHTDEYLMCQKDKEPHKLVTDLTGLKPTEASDKKQMSQFVDLTKVKIILLFGPHKVAGQFFVFSTVQNIMDSLEFMHKVIDTAWPNDKLKANASHSQSQIEEKKIFDPNIYQIYGMFRSKTQGNSTSYMWTNGIKPFRNYYMIVNACSRGQPCFVVAHKKLKTRPLENGDDIDEHSVQIVPNDTFVTIQWSEPMRPNGAILSYQIHLSDTKNRTKTMFCINRAKFIAIKQKFIVRNLSKNTKYVFKMRTKSMHGFSNWSKEFNFSTTGAVSKGPPIFIMALGLSVLLLAFIFTAAFCYIKSPKRNNSQLDIISVNPEYEKFIVDPEWEKKRSDIQMFHVLGDGAFGRVYYGELRMGTKLIKCAVKTLTANHRTQQRESFLKEANIMKSFIDCHHIVKLIGIVSIENPILVLMEYMVNGDLKTYLRSNRPDNEENPNPRVPTWNRIFQMAIEISDGMAYLSSRKFVHRDLAARNCMVAEDLTVKIGDFGMTRDVYDNDYYRKRDCGLIPVRWMSPEALRDGVFTTYSDIWAYGVVLWEMITMGAQPYQGYSNESVFQGVVRGTRLTEPDNCPKKLWRIMQFCWRKNPRTRPSFNEITEHLLPSANQSFREVCYYLNRKPLVKKQESLKNIWYSLIPLNKLLLNDIKQLDNESDNSQYCQMEPQIQRRVNLSANEYTEKEVEILKKYNLSEMNAKNFNEVNNSTFVTLMNIADKHQEQTDERKLIEC